MLDVNQLSRWYGEFKAVDKVSFSIGKGEIVGLLGHNGAGKTTIMKMLSGYLEPNNGDIKINNSNISDDLKTIQRQLGYLPENLPIYPEMTVADYLDYAAELKGLTGNNKTQELKRAIKATELEVKLLDPIVTLSRGYKQRVGVAQAILGKPKLLILDEPTNGLDPTQTEHMRNLIKEIAKDATVILSTHIMQEVDAICDRVIIIRNGQVAVDAKLEELRQSNNIMLSCSIGLEQLTKLLKPLVDIESISLTESIETPQNSGQSQTTSYAKPVFEYHIKISKTCEQQALKSQIARLVIQADGELYNLNQQHLDLETLFKQVNQNPVHKNSTYQNPAHAKEVKNAA